MLVDGTRAQPGAPNGGQGVRRALEQGVIERGRLVTTGKPATGEHVLLRGVGGLRPLDVEVSGTVPTEARVQLFERRAERGGWGGGGSK